MDQHIANRENCAINEVIVLIADLCARRSSSMLIVYHYFK